MKTRILPLAFVAALVLAFGAIAAACGGGGEPLTLEEYFQRLDEVLDNADDRFEALVDQCREDVESAESELAATRCFFDASAQVLKDVQDETDDLDPPAEAAAAHEELVTAGADFEQLVDDFGERFGDIESMSELEELSEAPELEEAGKRVEQACFDVEEIARENDIEVGLDCDG